MTDPRISKPDMDRVDALFDAARRVAPEPSDDLMRRILVDADAVQADRPASLPVARQSGWRQLLAALGGWPSVGGLATAAVAGFYIGLVQPDLVGFGAEGADENGVTLSLLEEDDDVFFDTLLFDEG